MHVEIFTGDLPDEWDRFVESCETACPCHASAWKSVIQETYGLSPYYMAVEEEGDIAGVLPAFHMKSVLFGSSLTSLPFLTYGGVCARTPRGAAALVSKATELARNLRAPLELRHTSAQKLNLPSLQHKVSMVMEVETDEGAMWNALRSEIRNRIRKAQKLGVEVVEGGEELVPGFYEVFAENMRDLGSPVHKQAFFTNMLRFAPDQVSLVCAKIDGQVVGGGITVSFGKGVEMPWASALRRFSKCAPNNAVYWHAIAKACREGRGTFDFGRSTPGSGTFEFKRRWGAKPMQLYWQRATDNIDEAVSSGHGQAFRAAEWLWKRMPISVTKIMGPPLRRGISL